MEKIQNSVDKVKLVAEKVINEHYSKIDYLENGFFPFYSSLKRGLFFYDLSSYAETAI